MDRIKVYLTLIGNEFDPNYVTEKTGIEPDSIRTKHEKLGNGEFFGHTEWGIESPLVTGKEIEPVLWQLFDRLSCTPQTLYKIGEECGGKWDILFLLEICDEDGPVLYFSRNTIQYAAEMGAAIGFDTYIKLETVSEEQ